MPFELVIVTPQREAFRQSVDRVVLPGSEGEFGVLEGHERFLCPLRQGAAVISVGASTVYAALDAGFARVEGQSVSVLVSACELGDEIDLARSRAAESAALEALGMLGVTADPVERARHEGELARARNLIDVAARAGRS